MTGFDKICHSGIFLKLINRKLPLCFLRILIYWYSNLTSVVKWNGFYSQAFKVLSGVRQGGVLSPRLFAIYMDELLVKLRKARVGCHIMSTFLAALVYADDIVLLAPTRSALQFLLNIAENYAKEWCIVYNPLKTKVMKFGKSLTLRPLRMYEKDLGFVDQYKYLGVNVVSDRSFKVNSTLPLIKFRSCVNTIINVNARPSEHVLLKLLYSNCVPILTYACEVTCFSSGIINEMNVSLNDAIRKIFSYDRWESTRFLRTSFGYPSITEIFEDRHQSFMIGITHTRNPTLLLLRDIVI